MLIYNQIRNQKKSFQESKEGYTYVPLFVEEKATPKILTFMPLPEIVNQWNPKVKTFLKKIKTQDTDDFD
jgi:rRNA maturation protein Rpf1